MAQDLAKAAAVAAAAAAAAGGGDGTYPSCPIDTTLVNYHMDDACSWSQARPNHGTADRSVTYQRLLSGGTGATLVPNQRTVVCPVDGNMLSVHDTPDFVTGFDTTWVVENTSSEPVVVTFVDHNQNGKEVSPNKPELHPLEDPQAQIQPGQWKAFPVYEGFLYQVRAIEEEGSMGDIVLQHRAGLVPIGKASAAYDCDPTAPDVEPIHPQTAERLEAYSRTPTHPQRRCNTIDVGFRNQVGCPLHVYWAGSSGSLQAKEQAAAEKAALEGKTDGDFHATDAKESTAASLTPSGFQCAEQFRFHLGTKPATQDFMHDWESSTKFEGSLLTHTFVARLAADPNVVVDTYTLQPTGVIDCPCRKKQAVASKSANPEAVEVQADINVGNADADADAGAGADVDAAEEIEIDADGNLQPPRVDGHIAAGAGRGGESGQI